MSAALDIVFPPDCPACGRLLPVRTFFCEACDDALERLPQERCFRCAEPGRFSEDTCPRCAARPPPFAQTFAPFAHQGPLARAIHRFKYEDHPELAAPLAALLTAEARSFLATAPRTVCAVPLHPRRRAERKYDQSELLAQELCRLQGQERLLALDRTRKTARQVGLTDLAREKNVHQAFTAREGVAGLELLLVDDVFTTGATARAAASALLLAGARKVQVIALARAFS